MMMNVQTMRYMVDALHTGQIPAVAQNAVKYWQGEQLTYVRSSANHIFSFVYKDKLYFLRLAHELERNRAYLQAEVDFILHCARMGLAVACPILSIHEAYIEPVDSDEGLYYAVAFEGLQGTQYEADELDETKYRAWGRSLAHLHLASKSFPAHPIRSTWQDQISTLIKTLPAQEHALAQLLESGLNWLNQLPVQDFGLIHGDFEQDNIVWDEEQVQVLDFDAAIYTWYAVDLAIALQDVYLSDGLTRNNQLNWFFEGYTDVRPLADHSRENIPRFLNLILAVKIAQLLHAYATTYDHVTYPEWLMNMKKRHHNWLLTKRALLKWD